MIEACPVPFFDAAISGYPKDGKKSYKVNITYLLFVSEPTTLRSGSALLRISTMSSLFNQAQA